MDEKNIHAKLIYRLWDEAWNLGRVEVVDEICRKNMILYAGDNKLQRTEQAKEVLLGTLHSFPDMKHFIDDIFHDVNKAAVRWHGIGTFQNEFNGVAATGKLLQYSGITI